MLPLQRHEISCAVRVQAPPDDGVATAEPASIASGRLSCTCTLLAGPGPLLVAVSV